MRRNPIQNSRVKATAVFLALVATPVLGHSQPNGNQPITLSRVASVRLEAGTGGVQRFFDAPAVLPSGRMFTLRMPDRKLFLLDVHGGSLTTTEVATPRSVQVSFSLTIYGAGRLLILDAASSRVFRFGVSGSTLRENGSFAVENGATALCAMHGRIYVYQPASASPITAYSEAGNVIRKFGRQFGSGSPIRRETMSRAQLHCSAPQKRLLVASSLTGEIQAFGELGEPRWMRRLPGIVSVPVLDAGGGRIAMTSPPEGYHVLLSVTTLTPGQVLVQYGLRGPRQDAGFISVHSRRLALSTGTETGRQNDLPGWLTSLSGTRAVSLDQHTGTASVWRTSEKQR